MSRFIEGITHGHYLMYHRGCRCPKCRRANALKTRTYRTQEKTRRSNLKQSYGITLEEYDAMLAAQGGVCGACGGVETGRNAYGVVSLAVDHDHETGKIRGLLCMKCNRALGLIGDSIEAAKNLLRYLKEAA